MSRPAARRPWAFGTLAPLGAVGLTAACYAGVLTGGLIWDDWILVTKAALRGWALVRVFVEPFFVGWASYYRPLTTLSYALQVGSGHGDPSALHTVNVFLHLVNVALVYAVARRFGAQPARAGAAAAAWGVFPRLTEAVSWISGRTDLLATLCVLAALLAAGVDAPRRRAWAAAWFGAGLLFKEVAFAVLPALAVLEARRAAGSVPERARRVAIRLAPAAALGAAYLAARFVVLAGREFTESLGAFRRVTLFLQSVGTFVTMILSPLRPRTFIGDKDVPSIPLEILGAAALVAVGAVLAHGLARWTAGTLAAFVLALAAFLPVVHLVPIPATNLASDRYLYLPLAGLAVALAAGAPPFPSESGRRLSAVAFASVLVVFSWATVRRNREWQDEAAFWNAALDQPPRNPVFAWTEVAEVLFRSERFAESASLRLRLIGMADVLSPAARRNQKVMASICLAEAGREDQALGLIDGLIAAEPSSPALRTNAAVVELRRLNFPAARHDLSAALHLDPPFPPARSLLATVDLVEAETKTPPPTPGVPGLARRARLLEQAGLRSGVEAWSAVAASESESAEDRLAGLRFVVDHGPVARARGALDEAARRAPGAAGLADLDHRLRLREARERVLDALIARLGPVTIP